MLHTGDTIGLISPCARADRERYAPMIEGIKALGFRVKEGRHLYNTTLGYAASERERAEDFNAMILDEEVAFILFGGGDVGNGPLPFLDYDAIEKHPKPIASYSNGTTILNAVHARTGLTTYYNPSPRVFADISAYNKAQFQQHFMQEAPGAFVKGGPWKMLHSGACEGTLIGGYAEIAALQLGSPFFRYDESARHILFLEDHKMFHSPGEIAGYLAFIGQHPFIKTVTGLIFGEYGEENEDLLAMLSRFGEAFGIPVYQCDDFGHGARCAIFPIGRRASLSDNGLVFL